MYILQCRMKRFHSCPPNTSPTILFPNSTSSLQSSNTSSTLNSYSTFTSLPTFSSPISNSLPVINYSSHKISPVSFIIPQSNLSIHVVFNYFTSLFILFNILHKNRFILLPHFLI